VLFDALGTLVDLDAPWVPLASVLEMDEAEVATAVRAEMDYYKEHSHEGKDATSLDALRARCADILSWELDREVPLKTMMDAFEFYAFDDARPALDELRKAGLRLVCVSNWDISLPEVLERCGLDKALDGVVTSAEAGVRKPDPAIFTAALNLAGCGPDEALHVGDTVAEDIAGAGAAGIRALHIDRAGGGDISSLAEVARAVRSG
jgi:putative hydrolase of the HAD superfamily